MVSFFDPKGAIALQERDLFIFAVALLFVLVVPVFVLLFTFARKYRAGNEKARYEPDGGKNSRLHILWWVILGTMISALGVMNWKSTHALDPYKPIASAAAPLAIQVVALPWKWLFIYPAQNIATVNFMEFPAGAPISFELTADAPMSSFWIPQLGGQMYAMTGMSTQLHLIANEPGDFRGGAAEINGRGFSGMKFIARAAAQGDFDRWVTTVKQASTTLTFDGYRALAMPSENNPASSYASVESGLYDEIIMQFMAPGSMIMSPSSSMPMMPGMHM